MSQLVDSGTKSFIAGAALGQWLRVKLTAGKLALAGATDVSVGVLTRATFADGDPATVKLRNAPGTRKMVASGSVTAGNSVYAAGDGKVASSGTVIEGLALESASDDGDIIEVLPLGQTDGAATDIGGTTAAAFLVDSDASTPKIELAAQAGGTGNYKLSLKPPALLAGNRAITFAPDADGVVRSDAVFAATAAATAGAGNSIPAGYQHVNVVGVANDADDFIVLPAIADVPIGHTIRIACNAASNFEMRTPASSNTKINDVDADGSQEYLCTDTDLVIVTKHTTTGWVAQSITKLGAVRTAVVPD